MVLIIIILQPFRPSRSILERLLENSPDLQAENTPCAEELSEISYAEELSEISYAETHSE